jgi:hypothetical protein
MGEEQIDGKAYRHYRIQSDLARLMDALAGAFGDEVTDESMLPAGGFSGPVLSDIWLDSETLLPYRLTAEGSFSGGSTGDGLPTGEMEFKMAIVLAEYNGYVTMPEPPADARPLSELRETE